MTYETDHFYLIVQKWSSLQPNKEHIINLEKIFGREKEAKIANAKYYKNGNFVCIVL